MRVEGRSEAVDVCDVSLVGTGGSVMLYLHTSLNVVVPEAPPNT